MTVTAGERDLLTLIAAEEPGSAMDLIRHRPGCDMGDALGDDYVCWECPCGPLVVHHNHVADDETCMDNIVEMAL